MELINEFLTRKTELNQSFCHAVRCGMQGLTTKTLEGMIKSLAVNLAETAWIAGAEELKIGDLIYKEFDFGSLLGLGGDVRVQKVIKNHCVIRLLAYMERKNKQQKEKIEAKENFVCRLKVDAEKSKALLFSLYHKKSDLVECYQCAGRGSLLKIDLDTGEDYERVCHLCEGAGCFIVEKEEEPDGGIK